MINATDNFIAAINADSRSFVAKVLKNNVEIECDLRDIKINKQAFGDTELAVGAVTSAEIQIVADGVVDALENEDIEIRIGIRAGDDQYICDEEGRRIITKDDKYIVMDNTDFIRLGFFTISKIRSTTFETEIKGVGFISSKLNKPFEIDEETTPTLANIAGAIASISGVPVLFKDGIDSSLIIRDSLEGLTCRDALEVITSVVGGFAAENADGGIEIHKFLISEEPLSVSADRVTEQPRLAELDYEMTGIAVAGKNGTFTSGTEIKQKYSNDYMTSELFEKFAENIVGYTYRPGEVPIALGDPRIEPWDTLLVTDLNDDVFYVPCHQITISFDGGLTTDVVAIGESDSQQETRTPLMKRLDSIEETAAEQSELIAALEHQIDGRIETWAQISDPSLVWAPEERERHINDLWLYTGTVDITVSGVSIHPQGVYAYIYNSEEDGYIWEAYSSATDNLFDLADGKATENYGTYPFTEITDAHVNDLAVDSGTKKIYRWDIIDDVGQWVEIDNYKTAIDDLREDLEAQIDGKIETWAQATDPSSGWAQEEKGAHLGDLWLYTGTSDTTVGGVSIHSQGVYKYVLENSTYKWAAHSSTSNNLFDLADGKATVYYGTYPFTAITSAHVNDLAVDSETNKLYRRAIISNVPQWVEVDNYATAVSALRNDLEAQIDKKIETYRANSDPFANELVADLKEHDGDLWFYTGASTQTLTQNATYRYSWQSDTETTHSTASWLECSVSEAVFDKIDGKGTIYYGTTSGSYPDVEADDYLVDSTDGSTYKWNGSAWERVTDYMTPISSQVVLEVTYSVADDTALFDAFVYVAGLPCTEQFADELFQWYRKTEDYENYPSGKIPLGSGKSITVDIADMEYGGVIRCEFNYQVEAYLLDENGNRILDKDGKAIIVMA